jgi:cell division protein ZapA
LKKETRVEIYGNTYTIRSEVKEEYTRQLARYVDGKMKEIAGGVGDLSSTKVAILAALNISNELFLLRDKLQQQGELVERKATKLISILDSRLKGVDA